MLNKRERESALTFLRAPYTPFIFKIHPALYFKTNFLEATLRMMSPTRGKCLLILNSMPNVQCSKNDIQNPPSQDRFVTSSIQNVFNYNG